MTSNNSPRFAPVSPPPAPTLSQQLLAAGESQLAQGKLDLAQQLLDRLLLVEPGSAQGHGLLAVLAMMRNLPQQAVELAEKAVSLDPANARLNFTLGRAQKVRGDLAAAVAAYRRAIELAPRLAEAHVSLGIALKAQGELDAAIECYEKALEIDPRLAVAHSNLGAAKALKADLAPATVDDDGLPTEAIIGAQQRAAELDPKNARVHRNLGAVLMRAGRQLAAAQAFNTALTLDPSDSESCVHMGSCLIALGHHDLACQGYEKWLAMNEQNAEIMRALSSSLVMRGLVDSGLEWARRAVAKERNPMNLAQLGSALVQSRRLTEGLAACREGVEASGRDPNLYPLYLMGLNYLLEDPQPLFDAHHEISERLSTLESRQPARSRQPGGRLRIGYVSGDFKRHSVAFFISPLLEHHDKSRYEVTCYSNYAGSDSVTQRLKSFGHRWVDIAHLRDDTLDLRLRADDIDIMVDLSGMTALSRLFAFARGPAPVQVGYLGYPTITGVPSMDFRITDKVIDPGDLPPLGADIPLALERSMFCFQPSAQAPALQPPPCLAGAPVTFGSFNNIAKVTDRTLALWAAVLQAVPGSRLLLKSTAMAQTSNRTSIEAFLVAAGIAPERLLMRAALANDSDHLAVYNEVDIGLDTLPYNGATTTCEALWMGVPVVTLKGRTHTSRMGASILTAIERTDWIAEDDKDYVRIAVGLAAARQTLAAWRLESRARIGASELLDGPGLARHFEKALETAWELRIGRPAFEPALATTAAASAA